MKYLNHFNKHLGGAGEGIIYPIQKGNVEIGM